MAIDVRPANVQIDSNVATNTPFLQALAAAQHAAAQGAVAGGEAQSAKELTKLKALLEGQASKEKLNQEAQLQKEAQDRAVSQAQDLSTGGKNVSVTKEGATISHDYTTQLEGKLGADFKHTEDAFTKAQKGHDTLMARLESATDGLKQGDAIGIKKAVVGMAGLTEGAGQRLYQSVIQSFGGDPSIVGSEEKLGNFITGLQQAGKSDAFKQSLSKALQTAYQEEQTNYGSDMAGLKMRAPRLSPLASQQPGFQQALETYTTPSTARLGRIGDNITSINQAQAALHDPTAPENTGIRGFLNRVFNQTPAPPPPPTPLAPKAPTQAPTAPQSPVQQAPTQAPAQAQAPGAPPPLPGLSPESIAAELKKRTGGP